MEGERWKKVNSVSFDSLGERGEVTGIQGKGDDGGRGAGEEEGLKSDIRIFHRRQTPTQGTAMTSSERLSPPLSDKNSHLHNLPV